MFLCGIPRRIYVCGLFLLGTHDLQHGGNLENREGEFFGMRIISKSAKEPQKLLRFGRDGVCGFFCCCIRTEARK